jgi:RNA polymerase sigma-B factor
MVIAPRPGGGSAPWIARATVRRLHGMSPSVQSRPVSDRPVGDLEAREIELMVLRYRPLALSLARRYSGGRHPREDLEQVACVGLIKAVRRFDPGRGCAFTTFAVPTILGELRRFCRDTGWSAHVPRGMQERARAVRHAADELSVRRGETPTVPQLAATLGWKEEEVVEALAASGTRSTVPLDAPLSDGEGQTPLDRLGDVDPGFDRVECLAVIETSLPALTAREKQVLSLRFGHDLPMQEIAERLDMPTGRVSRLLASALRTLRERVGDADFAPSPSPVALDGARSTTGPQHRLLAA